MCFRSEIICIMKSLFCKDCFPPPPQLWLVFCWLVVAHQRTLSCMAACIVMKACSVVVDEGAQVKKNYKETRRRNIFDFTAGCLERLTSAGD